jgi:hypothetical protein
MRMTENFVVVRGAAAMSVNASIDGENEVGVGVIVKAGAIVETAMLVARDTFIIGTRIRTSDEMTKIGLVVGGTSTIKAIIQGDIVTLMTKIDLVNVVRMMTKIVPRGDTITTMETETTNDMILTTITTQTDDEAMTRI